MNKRYQNQAALLLGKLITIESYSGNESRRSDYLMRYFYEKGIACERIHNNIIVKQLGFDNTKPTLMLNSHLDTVKPSSSYTVDPFFPLISDTHIYGLGSNDAGASVVSMILTFLHYYKKELPFNIILVLSCEEENSGPNGMRMIWEKITKVDFAIIGEPTGMNAATAERGLLVIDGEASGVSGHAAREEGVNAIYIALNDIEILKSTRFNKISPTMGEVKMTVTQINAGTQHNVIPDRCTFVVDIRPTEMYTNEEIMNILQPKLESTLKARSLTNKSSATPDDHLLMRSIKSLGIETYTSPTTSDWMRISCPAIKMGPGESSRSHQANEYILTEELNQGISGYIDFIAEAAKLITTKE